MKSLNQKLKKAKSELFIIMLLMSGVLKKG